MVRGSMYAILGYLSGSILFARVFAALLRKGDITLHSADGNPGTANAFLNGGFWCGVLTLCGDMLKGFLPVQMYLRGTELGICKMELILVLAAPVVGHLFPVFFGFHGGKGIAVTFGCLLGLFPELSPVLVLAVMFLFFSLVVRITPHCARTVWAYRCAAAGMLLFVRNLYITAAFLLIALLVNGKLQNSDEQRDKCQVRIRWRH